MRRALPAAARTNPYGTCRNCWYPYCLPGWHGEEASKCTTWKIDDSRGGGGGGGGVFRIRTPRFLTCSREAQFLTGGVVVDGMPRSSLLNWPRRSALGGGVSLPVCAVGANASKLALSHCRARGSIAMSVSSSCPVWNCQYSYKTVTRPSPAYSPCCACRARNANRD